MARKSYIPGGVAAQIAWAQNLLVKFPTVATLLGFTPAETTAVTDVAEAFVTMMQECGQSQISAKGITQWRNAAAYGKVTNKTVPAPPTVIQPTTPTVQGGFMAQLSQARDKGMASPNYTLAIGEDLGWVGPEITPRQESDVRPNLKSVTSSGNQVTITGSMQGFVAMRVYYAKKGGAFREVGVVTNTPATVSITPMNPDTPESGQIKTIFVKKNQPYGEYSPDFNVTLT